MMRTAQRAVFCALACLIMPLSAAAHPHRTVDQQMQVLIGVKQTVLRLFIAPSTQDGPTIAAAIDANGDGIVTAKEAERFGAMLLQTAEITLDGAPLVLAPQASALPALAEISAGHGTIMIEAIAGYDAPLGGAHKIEASVTFGQFAHRWFVQPYYDETLTATFGLPDLHRAPEANRVRINLSAPER